MGKTAVAALSAMLVCGVLAGCGGSSVPSTDYQSLSGEDEIAQATKDGLEKGIDFDGTAIKTIGDVKDVQVYDWIVVNDEVDEYGTSDDALVDATQCAAALASAYEGNPHVSKIVYNLSMDTDGTDGTGKVVPAMQITYSTKNPPSLAGADTLLKHASSYSIKPVLYNSLDKYKSVPQKQK